MPAVDSSPQGRIGHLIKSYFNLEMNSKKQGRASQRMLGMQLGVKPHETERRPLRTQGVRKFYLLVSETMSGDSVIQLEWALDLTSGQVCQRSKHQEVKLNVEGTQKSRVHDA